MPNCYLSCYVSQIQRDTVMDMVVSHSQVQFNFHGAYSIVGEEKRGTDTNKHAIIMLCRKKNKLCAGDPSEVTTS